MQESSVFNEWLNQLSWRKLLVPKQSSKKWKLGNTQTLSVGRTTVLEMTVQERSEKKELLPTDVKKYSQDLGYIPSEFKDERTTALAKHSILDCGDCHGSGDLPCPTEERCSTCKGIGEVERTCKACNGGGRESVRSTTVYQEPGLVLPRTTGRAVSSGERACSVCGGSGSVTQRCGSCAGRGMVTCSKCKGTGFVTCKRCAGGGKVAAAILLHRHFKTKTTQTSDAGQVPTKVLKGMRGQVISENADVPEGLVKRRETNEGFTVDVQECIFGKRSFKVLKIHGTKETRLRAPGHPWIWHQLFS